MSKPHPDRKVRDALYDDVALYAAGAMRRRHGEREHNTATSGELKLRHHRLVVRAAHLLDRANAERRLFTKAERDERTRLLREAIAVEELLALRRERARSAYCSSVGMADSLGDE